MTDLNFYGRQFVKSSEQLIHAPDEESRRQVAIPGMPSAWSPEYAHTPMSWWTALNELRTICLTIQDSWLAGGYSLGDMERAADKVREFCPDYSK